MFTPNHRAILTDENMNEVQIPLYRAPGQPEAWTLEEVTEGTTTTAWSVDELGVWRIAGQLLPTGYMQLEIQNAYPVGETVWVYYPGKELPQAPEG